ncbi:DUF397 domain-containing protein [Streptomyces sp. NPDC003758]|uniref:DUF397 domain-containing protein n=1 Tax=Streptomyces cynarae TaxID=2981134 RepID=A0ABY6E1E6_9ACTN|nr:DUF397 domain-containing protein [Streptomyces cynarae]UXY20422.1 DUF397 domain-containing protein [Streptomyces cynarae]
MRNAADDVTVTRPDSRFRALHAGWYPTWRSPAPSKAGTDWAASPPPYAIHVRDSKRTAGLTVPRDSWAGFLALARRG